VIVETERLILRPFRDADRDENAAIFADPEVRRFALDLPDRAASDRRMDRAVAELQQTGLAPLAVEDRRDGRFIGTLGLTGFSAGLKAAIPSHPEVQIAWQLARRVWGQGLAPEAARAMLAFAWMQLGLPEVVAITAVINQPSRRVMEKIGMHHEPGDDFLHPDIEPGHRLRPHVLYRIANPKNAPR
jgi:RimJ/RimL family protein N-acetyltransferase